ncbi:LGFP repeat-containing protein [Yinghuangia seranimata]|uniref:LGFP repeat-containing protein n=1 Tax=Yinghuangia seranimata TaxID=408067 RepID=UPI00248BEE95|nr:hypothetical protein [Yinghuangia seranimata]MDI2131173.1 hypothetical protein [Yinghuangia seranimata]
MPSRVSTSPRFRQGVTVACVAAALAGGLPALAGQASAAPVRPSGSAAQAELPQAAPTAAAAPQAAPAAVSNPIGITMEIDAQGALSLRLGWTVDDQATQWRVSVLQTDAQAARVVATVPRTGAETAVPLPGPITETVLRVEALDAAGNVQEMRELAGDIPLIRKYGAAGGAARFGERLWETRNYVGTTWGFADTQLWWTWGDREAFVVPNTVVLKINSLLSYEREGLGKPVTDPITMPDGKGTVQYFSGGAVVVPPGRAAVVVFGQEYRQYGGPSGVLGYPLADRVTDGSPVHQRFERGTILMPGGRPNVVLFGGIHAKWLEQGGATSPWLAQPLSGERPTPDHGGVYVEFEGGWRIYWSAATGAHLVDPVSYAKWASAGGPGGYLGYPVTDSMNSARPFEYFIHFQRGSVYPGGPILGTPNYTRPRYIVMGGVRDVWAATGWAGGTLGDPQTDELSLPDGVGRYQMFEYGAVFWNPRTGAHWINHGTRGAWEHNGGGTGFLGYPIANQQATADGRGSYTVFERGTIYGLPQRGYFEVHGGIRATYEGLGGPGGRLGFPVDNEGGNNLDGNRMSIFEHGVIMWEARTGKITVSYW